MGTKGAALGVGVLARCAQHEEGRVLVRSRTRPKRVLRSVVGHLGQVTRGTRKRGHSPRSLVWLLPQWGHRGVAPLSCVTLLQG